MSLRDRVRRMLADIIHKGPEPWKPPPVAKQPPAPSAEGLRAREMADHKAWLRDNADSVTVPEHPAVALLRDLHALRGCVLCGHSDECAEGCRLAAIIAGSKPGARALSEVLAEARAAGRAEEREAICTWLSAEWGTQERTETNDLIGEVVQNIRDGQHARVKR